MSETTLEKKAWIIQTGFGFHYLVQYVIQSLIFVIYQYQQNWRNSQLCTIHFDRLKHPVQVPRWPRNFDLGIKTKFKELSGEI